jgi:hypothetical protein
MAHASFEDLQKLLHASSVNIEIGTQYRHYKDVASRYQVTGLCILEDTDEVAVKYISMLFPQVEFIRPLRSWLEVVDESGTEVRRFTKIKLKPPLSEK